MSDRVYWACADVLMVGVQLPTSPSLPAPAELRQRLLTALDAMVGKGRSLGIQDADLAEARYALVAFLDEQILKSSWYGRNEWMGQPLQLLLYQHNTAGENFFVRLRSLLQQGNRPEALHAYYLCLTLGFRGAYGVSGDMASLSSFTDAARKQLVSSLVPTNKLGPHAEPRERVQKTKSSSAPLIALIVGSLLLTALVVFGLDRLLQSDVHDALRAMPLGSSRVSRDAP
jgi:type VI secretion system protein ImpK